MQMEMLGRYKITTPLSNKNAGSCRWGYATCDGQEYFIKEFIDPKYPEDDTILSPQKREKKIQKCEVFEEKKTEIYRTINACSDGNVVRIDNFFRVGTKYYIAMPKISSVKMEVEDISDLPEHAKRRLCTIIAHSVAQLHKSKFVHADIKHANVLLTFSPQRLLTAKLIDFDAGFMEHDPPTHPEAIPGDQVYYAPEVWLGIQGEEVQLTCKLDVFSMGVLFHEYFSGDRPGFDKGFECTGAAVAMGAPVHISENIPADIGELISQMLIANPEERPTAQEVYRILACTDELSYRVCHEVEGGTKEIFTYKKHREMCPNGRLNLLKESIKPREYPGYRYEKSEPQMTAGETVEDGTLIIMKYCKDITQRKTVSYTVQHKLDSKILEQTTHSGSVWVNDPGELAIQTGTITPKPYAGCIFIGTNTSKQEGDVIPGGTVIVLKYETTVADPEPTALYEGFVKDAPAKPGLHSLGDL